MCFAFTQCLQVLPPSPWVEGRREACGPTVCSTAQGQVSSAKLPSIPHGDGARSAAQAWLPAALVLGEYSKLPAGEVQQPAVEAAPSGQGATSLMEPHAVGWPMLQVQGGTLAQGTPTAHGHRLGSGRCRHGLAGSPSVVQHPSGGGCIW